MKDLNLSRVGLTMEWRNGTAHSLFAERGPRREVLFQIRDLFPDRQIYIQGLEFIRLKACDHSFSSVFPWVYLVSKEGKLVSS